MREVILMHSHFVNRWLDVQIKCDALEVTFGHRMTLRSNTFPNWSAVKSDIATFSCLNKNLYCRSFSSVHICWYFVRNGAVLSKVTVCIFALSTTICQKIHFYLTLFLNQFPQIRAHVEQPLCMHKKRDMKKARKWRVERGREGGGDARRWPCSRKLTAFWRHFRPNLEANFIRAAAALLAKGASINDVRENFKFSDPPPTADIICTRPLGAAPLFCWRAKRGGGSNEICL